MLTSLETSLIFFCVFFFEFDGLPIWECYNACHDLVEPREVSPGGRAHVTCGQELVVYDNYNSVLLELYHFPNFGRTVNLLARYSITDSAQNYTRDLDRRGLWRIERSQRWFQESLTRTVLNHRLQLIIDDAKPNAAGNFICLAKLPDGVIRTCCTVLRMKGEMSMVDKNPVNEGDCFKVTCSLWNAESFPYQESTERYTYMKLIWNRPSDFRQEPVYQTNEGFKHNKILSKEWEVEARDINDNGGEREKSSVTLTIKNATCGDAGRYHCYVYYKYGWMYPAHDWTDVDVKDKVTDFKLEFIEGGKGRFAEGAIISMSCSAQGPRDLTFDWRFSHPKRNVVVSYPYLRHVEAVSTPVRKPGQEECVRYAHESKLTFVAEKKHDGFNFHCAVIAFGEEAATQLVLVKVSSVEDVAKRSLAAEEDNKQQPIRPRDSRSVLHQLKFLMTRLSSWVFGVK